MKEGNLQTLEEVVSKYQLVLMDNSVLAHYLGNKQDSNSIEEKRLILEEDQNSRNVLIDYIKKGIPCFVTSSVAEESQSGDSYKFKKIIKRAVPYEGKELLGLRRKIRDDRKKRRKLIDIFKDNNQVLCLNENEQGLYGLFDKSYLGLLSLYKLSKVDFNLLISGAVVSQTRKSSALIASDFGIVRAWNYIRRREKISTEQFGFVLRKGLDNFEILR